MIELSKSCDNALQYSPTYPSFSMECLEEGDCLAISISFLQCQQIYKK